MRILYVVHQFYPQFISGTEQYVLGLAQAGRAAGDDVRVFTMDPLRPAQEPAERVECYEFAGVPVTRCRTAASDVPNPILGDYHRPDLAAPFGQLLDDFRPDVVHCFHLRGVGIDRLTDVTARLIPCLVHVMDFWLVCPNFLLLRPDRELCDGPPEDGIGCFGCVGGEVGTRLGERGAFPDLRARGRLGEAPRREAGDDAAGIALVRRLPTLVEALGQAACVIAPSATVRDLLLANGHRPARLELIPYAIDWEPLDEIAPAPAPPITIGFVGTLAPHKGVDVLLEAMAGLPGDDLRLRVHGRFGDFPEFDERLRRLAATDPRIELAGGFPRERLGEVLGGLHTLVVPSHWRENTPFVCLEGRAAGLPVVASDLPGMAEAVPEGRGRLFRAGDAADLRRALTEVVGELRAGRRLGPDRSIPDLRDQVATFRRLYAECAAVG